MVHLDELERQVRLELVDDEPRAAVAGVHHDLELAQLALAIHVAQQVLEVFAADVERAARCPALPALRRQIARLG